MDSATSVERQLYILSLLSQNSKGYSLGEIIESLKRVGIDATRRMVARDMDSISRDFFVYEEDRGGTTVYKADKYAVSDMDFTMPQIISLYYIKELLGGSHARSLSREAAGIIDGILEQMPRLSKAALKEVEDMVKVVPQGASGEEVSDETLEAVRQAISGGYTLDMEYRSLFSEEATQRMFDPYVLEVRDGCWQHHRPLPPARIGQGFQDIEDNISAAHKAQPIRYPKGFTSITAISASTSSRGMTYTIYAWSSPAGRPA
jgi:proteasome accessory factor B